MKTHSIWMSIIAGALVVSYTGAQERHARHDGWKDVAQNINRSINIEDNSRADDLRSINGSITVGSHSEVKNVQTVNGVLSLGADSRATELGTVNGPIEVGSRSTVTGNITTVNGRLSVSDGATILGDARNVNGKIVLAKGAHVGRRLTTLTGDITLEDSARVDGGILIKKPNPEWSRNPNPEVRVPTVTIGPGAQVGGELIFEMPVKLRVHSTAQIGAVRGADVERY